MKLCLSCNTKKEFTEFHKSKSRKDGFEVYCKVCRKEKSHNRYVNNKDKILAKSTEWRVKNLEKDSANKKKYRDSHKKEHREAMAGWRKDNKEHHLKVQQHYRDKNKEKLRNYHRDWRLANPEKEALKQKKWVSKNLDKCSARTARRNAQKLKATPPWLSKEALKDMEFFYRIRSEMKNPSDWEVDHYFPLNGESAKGLHVPWNMRLITASENHKKQNKIPEVLPLGK